MDPSVADRPVSDDDATQPAPELFRQAAVEANASWGRIGEPLAIPRRRTLFRLLHVLGATLWSVGSSASSVIKIARRRVPFVPQVELADCGAACLAMVLGYNGLRVDIGRIRALTGANRDGVTARTIVTAARSLGLHARGVRTNLAGLGDLPAPAILHWNLNHFVVLESCHRGGNVTIVDPALGRRNLERSEVNRSFTGVALVFEGIDDSETADAARISSPWRLLAGLTRPRGRWTFVLALSLLLQIAAVAIPLSTRLVIDRVVPDQDYSVLRVLSLAAVALLIVYLLLSALRASALVLLQAKLDFALVTRLTSHLLDLPFAFFQARSSGDLLMRLRSSTVVREIFTTAAVSGLLDGAMVVMSLAVIVVVDWHVGLAVLTLAAFQALFLVAAWKPYRSLAAELLETQARSQGVLMEVLAGIETLKVAGASRRSAENWSNFFAREINVEVRRGYLDAVSDALVASMRTVAPLLVLLYGTYRLLEGSMTVGTLLAVVALATAFLMPLASLVTTILRFSILYGYLQRMQDILGTDREQDIGHKLVLERFSGRVVVDEVSHRYGPTSPWVLEGVSLTVDPGRTLGIVGASGSGKSTLAMIIAGLHTPASGHVLYDGQDLAVTDLTSLREQIAVVSQQSYIFAGSIRSNITLGDDDVPLEAIVAAARAAQLHDDVEAMPMGYDTIVSDGGATISGGQRQRIALARTFLRHPRLLILDEATSALDQPTESRVLEAIRQRGISRVIVAHRLSTVTDCDQIVVLEAGRVVEVGNHHSLLMRGGHYAALARLRQ